MSFTMTSPPCQIQPYDAEAIQHGDHNINAFSPSIFSPKDNKLTSRIPKKRDYKDSNTQVRGGIADVTEKVSPTSQGESQSSLDFPHALSLLESPHYSLWSTVQNGMSRNGNNEMFQPPTPTALLGAGPMEDERNRMWGQGDSHLFSATSQVMQMGASPLLEGDYLLGKKSAKGFRKGMEHLSPRNDILTADDSLESLENYGLDIGGDPHGMSSSNKGKRGSGASQSQNGKGTSRRKKPLVSPGNSLISSSSADQSLLVSPGGSSSVEKLSVAVKNQRFGLSSTGKPVAPTGSAAAASGPSTGRRVLKSQHSLLENYDLSQHFDVKPEETAGDSAQQANVKISAESGAVVESVTVCNCKKSKCLKLYCDCFAVMNYCSRHCNCYDCCNSTERESIRQDAIRSTKERNAFAFQTKINDKDQHSTGCHCKNSHCLKKYCECFTGGAFCGANCKCQACQNFSGSVDLAKARSSMRDPDGPGSSRKRKESPSSVAFLDNNTPPGSGKALIIKEGVSQAFPFSPELRGVQGSVGMISAAARSAAGQLPGAPRPQLMVGTKGGSQVITPSSSMQVHMTPTNAPASGSNSNNNADMQQVAKRSKTQTPVPADRQLRSRKPSDDAEDLTTHPLAAVMGSGVSRTSSGSQPHSAVMSSTKKHVSFAQPPIAPPVYPFFGPNLPPTSKVIALKCLDYLEGKDIYAMSQVNVMWSQAAMDDALWE